MTGKVWPRNQEASGRLLAAARDFWLLPLTVIGLALGGGLWLSGRVGGADLAWTIPTVIVAAHLAWSIIRDLLAGKAGVDLIALLAISGALLLNETFAAAVIAVMLASGQALERYAEGRAHRELTALLGRAPQQVHRYRAGTLEVVDVGELRSGDRVLVRPGEVVPVDGVVRSADAVLDESALTGESRLVTRSAGEAVASGVVNAGAVFELDAIATAEQSTYAGIVRLVEEAGRSKAPFVRLADRYAVIFVPVALAASGLAWLLSGDPVRGLAVLVVATPCPLLLAAPVAIVSGISRAARRGIIAKGGGPLETLARARVMLFDKTGTLTAGRPRLVRVEARGVTSDELLRVAAGLEQTSPHVLAAAIVAAARERGISPPMPDDVVEQTGAGLRGRIEGRTVMVGSASFVAAGSTLPGWCREMRRRAVLDGATNVFVRIDDRIAGVFVLADPLRAEAPRAIRSLRRAGFGRIVMVTGDHHAVAELVGAAMGLDGVLAERTPAEKVDAVHAERASGGPLVMVGDGINDAPALAAADVGIAMGARGATASSEAADLVITVDRLDRLPEAVGIARRSRQIAVQSVVAGMGMSLAAMGAAAFGFLPVVAGALLQEGIDVAVIVNALRALRGGVERPVRVPGWTAARTELLAAHRDMAPGIEQLRMVADGLGEVDPADSRRQLQAIRQFLTERLLPHELDEDREVYPMLAREMGTDTATSALHGTHAEIFHLVRLIDRLAEELGDEMPGPDDLADLRRALYGLDAILRLHASQEEELYLSIGESESREPLEAPA
jgi:heavy metal translocating P-type ATPase